MPIFSIVFVFATLLATFLCLTTPGLAQEQNRLEGDGKLAPLDIFRDCNVCPEMVVLPMGSFTMGAPLEQSAFLWSLWNKPQDGVQPGMPQEGPEHEVIIDMPIAMGRNEVTRGEWLACVAHGGCTHMPDPRILKFPSGYHVADDPRHPVFDLTYFDMQDYVAWLNQTIGKQVYRLPTEAEWEYAARAGTQTRFAQGDSLTTDQANIATFHWEGERYVADPESREIPVTVDELDAANAWGLRHMAGNLLELTMTCWSDRHLGLPTSSAYLTEARRTASCRRVGKGGSYGSGADLARPANRGAGREDISSGSAGFRVLRELLER